MLNDSRVVSSVGRQAITDGGKVGRQAGKHVGR